MCSIIGVGERLHKVLGLIDLGTLDSGERSLPFGLLVKFYPSKLTNETFLPYGIMSNCLFYHYMHC